MLGDNIKALPQGLSLISFVISSILLLIWIFVPSLKEYSAITMKANSASCLVLASIALAILKEPSTKNNRIQFFIARACSAAVFLIGLLTTIQYFAQIDLGIDQLIVTDFLNEESRTYPGRMSPIASICFVMLGLGLFFLKTPSEKTKGIHLSSMFFLPLSILSFFTTIGYLYGEQTFYKVGPYIRISPITAGLIFMLCLGGFIANPTEGPVKTLLSRGLGGLTSRKLLPFVTALPLALGLLRTKGEELGWYDLQLGVSIYAMALVLILLSMLLFVSNQLDEFYFREIELKEKEQYTSNKIKETAERLAEAVKARDEFLSISSHELKTPLTSLRLQAQLMKRSIQSNSFREYTDEQMYKIVDQTDRQVTRLNRLIDDMLDITRIRSGKFSINKEKFDFADLVTETVARLKPMFEEAKASVPVIERRDSSIGYWDKMRIEQVMNNLLLNALRYGEGRPISVNLIRYESALRISIQDQGIGIDKERLDKIFDRFERAISANEISGLGLGLFIVRQIVQAHGGRAWGESELGQGSTFHFELPLLRDEPFTS